MADVNEVCCNEMEYSQVVVVYPPSNYGLGCVTTQQSVEEREKQMRTQRILQALHILTEATSIRKDPALMEEIRSHVRAQRDLLGNLLDEL